MPQVEFGQFKSDKFDMKFNYELWIPEDLQVKDNYGNLPPIKFGNSSKSRSNNFHTSSKMPNFMTIRCLLKSMVVQAVIKLRVHGKRVIHRHIWSLIIMLLLLL